MRGPLNRWATVGSSILSLNQTSASEHQAEDDDELDLTAYVGAVADLRLGLAAGGGGLDDGGHAAAPFGSAVAGFSAPADPRQPADQGRRGDEQDDQRLHDLDQLRRHPCRGLHAQAAGGQGAEQQAGEHRPERGRPAEQRDGDRVEADRADDRSVTDCSSPSTVIEIASPESRPAIAMVAM